MQVNNGIKKTKWLKKGGTTDFTDLGGKGKRI